MNSAANRLGQVRSASPAVGFGAPDGNRLEPGQGHRDADAAEKRPAVNPGGLSRMGRFLRLASSSFDVSRHLACSFARVVLATPIEELRAGDDRLDQAAEAVAVGREPLAHGLDGRIVRGQQAAPQGVGQQLAAEVVDELVLALLGEVAAQAVEARPLAAVGEGRAGIDRPAAEVEVAELADRAVAFEDQADRVEPLVAAGAALVGRGAGPAAAAASGRPAWPRPWAVRGRPAAARGCSRRAAGGRPSSRA